MMEHEDSFMNIFKYYKSNSPKPSLKDVISVENDQHVDKVVQIIPNIREDERNCLLGLQKFDKWQSYSFKNHPGLYLIRHPFTSLGQRYWIRRCLEDYPRKPNKTNIDAEMVIEDWWKASNVNGECNQQLLKKLRWSTLGYHHNWDTKVYSEENRTQFPADLAELSDIVACYLGYQDFRAEAAIVNYYHMKSTLSAHTDHSEVNLEAPLFSFSYGQSAIFLLGGQDKSTPPSAVLLQSGDIMVMSEQARLCYHAVPKILPATSRPWNVVIPSQCITEMPTLKHVNNPKELFLNMNRNIDDTEWCKFSSYVESSRVNMNVRQVLKENQNHLTDSVFIGS